MPAPHMNMSNEKSDEIIELEVAVMSVLSANPKVGTYEAFREAFSSYLTTKWHFEAGELEYALIALDQGRLELPEGIHFSVPWAR